MKDRLTVPVPPSTATGPYWVRPTLEGVELWKNQKCIYTFVYADYPSNQLADHVAITACSVANGWYDV